MLRTDKFGGGGQFGSAGDPLGSDAAGQLPQPPTAAGRGRQPAAGGRAGAVAEARTTGSGAVATAGVAGAAGAARGGMGEQHRMRKQTSKDGVLEQSASADPPPAPAAAHDTDDDDDDGAPSFDLIDPKLDRARVAPSAMATLGGQPAVRAVAPVVAAGGGDDDDDVLSFL
jgi:hypothetical protein